MKKILAMILVIAAISMVLGVTAFAAENPVKYYDANGNAITVNGMYYDDQGRPMYGAGCYYLDEDGNPVYVGGCRAYYRDSAGNLVAGNYYYDQNGNAVPCPAYSGGRGCCGGWR